VIDVQRRPELVVTRVDPETPAASALQPGDVIVGANRRLFPEWEDPRVPVGYAIAAAQTEAFDGTLMDLLRRSKPVPAAAEHRESKPSA